MVSQYSTALSDGVLALSAFYLSAVLHSVTSIAAIGFILMAAAASLGVIRFSCTSPSDNLVSRHKYMSQLTASLGLPMIAVAYLKQLQPILAYLLLTIAVSFFIFQKHLSQRVMKLAADVLSGVAMLMIVVHGIFNQNMYSVFGVGVFAFAALIIRTDGYFRSIPRVDLFHYALVFGIVLLKEGLLASCLPDVYFRP